MTPLDRILSLAALALMVAYFSVLVWRVPNIDLTILLIGVACMAAYDFYFHGRRRRT